MQINWTALWDEAIAHFCLGAESIHGPEHWRRVERYGMMLAEHSGGDILVVRLFAVCHDVCRWNDGIDNEHGVRGAAAAARWRGKLFTLPDETFALLHEACCLHTSGLRSDDPTIGACWDADRLDLWRAGITPRENMMSTEHARKLVRARKIGPRYVPTGSEVSSEQ